AGRYAAQIEMMCYGTGEADQRGAVENRGKNRDVIEMLPAGERIVGDAAVAGTPTLPWVLAQHARESRLQGSDEDGDKLGLRDGPARPVKNARGDVTSLTGQTRIGRADEAQPHRLRYGADGLGQDKQIQRSQFAAPPS